MVSAVGSGAVYLPFSYFYIQTVFDISELDFVIDGDT